MTCLSVADQHRGSSKPWPTFFTVAAESGLHYQVTTNIFGAFTKPPGQVCNSAESVPESLLISYASAENYRRMRDRLRLHFLD
jgi:hypothetical protein